MSHQYGWYLVDTLTTAENTELVGKNERRKLTIGIACEQSLHLGDINRDLTIRLRRRPWQRRWKIAPASFQTISRLSQVAQLLKRRKVMLELRRGVQKEMVEFIALPFPSSKKLKIWSFHVVVVQERQRSVQKSVMHVQSCCFANLILLLFEAAVAVAVEARKETRKLGPLARAFSRGSLRSPKYERELARRPDRRGVTYAI